MVLKKIIFQNRYMALETPSRPLPPFMANTILNFHFDYWHTSLRCCELFFFFNIYLIMNTLMVLLDNGKYKHSTFCLKSHKTRGNVPSLRIMEVPLFGHFLLARRSATEWVDLTHPTPLFMKASTK